ncbi:hypothetical protein DQ04_09521020 [Trypanosoma grayi]|uniref:hypothetical protein n=1 Tax=Trypanosoma grayi TaxID=71804 RepID=UPI0004F461BC|nr:hypothetical protein DQ04_09521020 [Trypanosoma grayi]KEG07533.1 hypothetical protein DQ04_09521020 [Trypanosoma grayi]
MTMAAVPTPPAATVPPPPPAATVPPPPPAATVPPPPPAATVPPPPPAATVPPQPAAKVPASSGTFQVTLSNSYQPVLPPVPPMVSSAATPMTALPVVPSGPPLLQSSASVPPPVVGAVLPQVSMPTAAPPAPVSVPTATTAPGNVLVAAAASPAFDVVPPHIPVVPHVVWYNEQIQHVAVPPARVAPSKDVRSLRELRGKGNQMKPSLRTFANRYLWQPAPSAEITAREPWRGVYWQHVDVHRYIARRYCGNPPPIE